MPPFNPSANRITTAKGAGLPNQQGLNNPTAYNGQGYNTFGKGHYHPLSTRYSDIRPFYCTEAIEGDVVRFRTDFKLNSFTLKQPMIMPLELHQDFFSVPWSAMLDNWDLIYKVPLTGSDIPANAHPLFRPHRFLYGLVSSVGANYTPVSALDTTWDTSANSYSSGTSPYLNWFLLACMMAAVFGQDSVLKHVGHSFPSDIYVGSIPTGQVERHTGDTVLALMCTLFAAVKPRFICRTLAEATADSTAQYFTITCNTAADVFNVATRFMAGELDITQCDVSASLLDGTIGTQLQAEVALVWQAITSGLGDTGGVISDDPTSDKEYYIDMKRVIAYQMCVAQYFSNPNVDVIATAKDWKRNQRALLNSAGYNPGYFTYRGSSYQYDIFSNAAFSNCYNCMTFSGGVTSSYRPLYQFWMNMFGMAHSLRNGDYFYSARLEPLAVDTQGNTSIPVSSNTVQALDVNKGLLYQRFVNAINRTSGEIYEYMSNMSGVKPERIAPQPNFIAHQVHKIGDEEIENTAGTNVEAGKTALYHSHTDNFVFEVFNDEPSVVIGLLSFQMPYIYPHFTDRLMWQRDRYDWFQPMLQDVGDQEVNSYELDANLGRTFVWGYQLRYAQFKYGVNHASGAFAAGKVPSYAMMPEYRSGASQPVMSSAVLRNFDNYFDNFYSSLTDVDPCGRFHFLISFFNDSLVNSRQAAFPKLL